MMKPILVLDGLFRPITSWWSEVDSQQCTSIGVLFIPFNTNDHCVTEYLQVVAGQSELGVGRAVHRSNQFIDCCCSEVMPCTKNLCRYMIFILV